MPQSSLDIALQSLAEFPDVFLFPIADGRKTPPLITNNLNDASNDPEAVKRWHAKWPGCEWGVSLRKSNLVVVDVDTKPGKSGAHTYDAISLLFDWPRTRTVRSPSGGLHYWYSGKHINALGEGGFGKDIDSPNYVLLPGCAMKDGTKYELIDDYPIEPAPDWFYENYLRDKGDRSNMASTADAVVDFDKSENVDWAIYYLKHDAPPSIEGQRGELTTLKVAAELRDHGLSEIKTLELMNEFYNVPGSCDPLWEIDGENGLRKKINNAFVYANLNAPGAKTAENEFADEPNPFSNVEIVKAALTRKTILADPHAYSLDRLVKDWVWMVGQKRFVRRRDGIMWDTQSFDSQYNYLMAKAPSISRALFKMRSRIKRFDSMIFRPGQPEELDTLYNTWRASPIEPAPGDTSLWDAHLAYLFPDEHDRSLVLNWLAWVYQYQDKKPNHALLIVGETMGTGKSLVARIFSKLIGERNTQRPKNSSLKGDFNGWVLQCKLAIIEELMQIGRREVANELRDIITEPTVEVNIKNVPAFLTENHMAMFAISNHPDALPLDEGDRRWLVVGTLAEKHPDEHAYYSKLFAMLDDPVALAAIAHQLKTRDLHGYSALGNAKITDAKRAMIAASMSDVDQWLTDQIGQWPLSARVVCVRDIISLMPAHLQRTLRLHNAIASFLRRALAGKCLGQRRIPPEGERVVLWALHGTPVAMLSGDKDAGTIYMADRDRSRSGSSAKDDFSEDAAISPED